MLKDKLTVMVLIYSSWCLDNVAFHKTTSQQPDGNYNKYSSRAVDGIYECNTSDLAISGNAYYPWWQVDLGELYDITMIIVYGRSDGLNPGNIFLLINEDLLFSYLPVLICIICLRNKLSIYTCILRSFLFSMNR